ncbi:la-related protein 6C-like [Miscanthus floridulus]|uniref:la-related protein 6C-like n=1 Tax=Miscanthus floridulus TaxID=154761 RepID=UPI00345A5B46
MAQEMISSKCATKAATSDEDGAAVAAAVAPPGPAASASATPFKFNVHAPEFVPMSPAPASPIASPMSAPAGGYYSPFMQMQPGLAPADWSFFHDQEPVFFMADFAHAKFGAATATATAAGAAGSNSAQAKGTAATTDVAQKIVKQVEYQFSDINLVANEFLLKIMNKDTEGYVPLSVIASWKKIKSLGATNQMLVKALRTSTKLNVSDDGKKVRRRQPFTEKHKEELQSRMIIAENLPEDSSRNSLEKIFGVVGSVKNIKICHPQEPSTARASKSDTLVSNKMHALVEYETSQQAEKAVEKLNDERNWRKGLRVRTVLRRSPKSVMRLKRADFDHFVGSDDDSPHSSQMSSDSPTADYSSPAAAEAAAAAAAAAHAHAHVQQQHQEDQQQQQNGGSKQKGWARGRGTTKLHITAPQSPQSAPAGMAGHFDPSSPRTSSSSQKQCPSSPGSRQQVSAAASASSQKCPFSPRHQPHPPQGPRMPDGTRGFTMGRGKPTAAAPTSPAAAAARATPAPVLV